MSDTKDIDNKKNTTTSSSNASISNVLSMCKTIITYIILLIIYIFYGGSILYFCKLAQSNILPTDSKCFPYTNSKPTIASITSNIFINNNQSMKINFPQDEHNLSNYIIDIFRNYKNKPTANFLVMYFISIVESLISFNYASKNYILNLMNNFPEFIIILLGPIIYNFFSFFILFIEGFYFIYLWYANMKWFFKTNSSSESDSKPNWSSVTFYDIINFCIGLWLAFIFTIIFIIFNFMIPILSLILIYTSLWCSVSFYGYKSKLNNKNIIGFGIGSEIFKFYKITIQYVIAIIVIFSAYTNLGGYGLIYSILSLILVIYLHITNLFYPIHIEGLSDLIEVDQATKICKKNNIANKIMQGGSKILINEIKKLQKQI